MALPPDPNNQAFLREVDEELRREQLLTLWRRWGRWILGAVVVALLALAGFLYFQSRGERVAGKQGEDYDAAMREMASQPDQALEQFGKLAGSGSEGFQAMARFWQANALLAKNDVKGAGAKFGEIAADTGVAQPYRDLALVRQTAAEYDALKPEVVVQRLQPLATPESPFFGTAGEMLAIAYLRQNKAKEAGQLFGQIANGKDVPDSVRQRAVQMASLLGVDVIDQTGEKKAQ